MGSEMCIRDRASTSLKLYEEMRREYKTLSKDNTDIVRVHHDNDKSFEGVCADAWRKDNPLARLCLCEDIFVGDKGEQEKTGSQETKAR